MSEPEKVHTTSTPDDAGVKSQLYKCMLNQQVQKLWKQLPVYQTINEGSEHLPKFRTTVWVNGVSYASPNTFQQRKMAEMDASKITYLAIMHKLRIEASQLVHENKHFCKSILVEYAARMKLQQPTYRTIQLDAPIPIFRSSLVFNDISWTGDDSRNKKEAEQSAARVVVLKYLDSEFGNIMSEIIKIKFKHYDEMKNIQSAESGTNVVVQIESDNGLTLNEAKGEEGVQMPNMSQPQEPCLVRNATMPVTHLSVDVNQAHIPQVQISAPTPVVPVPTVLAQTLFAGTNVAPTSTNVNHLENSEASYVIAAPQPPLSSPALAQPMTVSLKSSKKRNRKNKKNANKKMRAENQSPLPAIAPSQVPIYTAQ